MQALIPTTSLRAHKIDISAFKSGNLELRGVQFSQLNDREPCAIDIVVTRAAAATTTGCDLDTFAGVATEAILTILLVHMAGRCDDLDVVAPLGRQRCQKDLTQRSVHPRVVLSDDYEGGAVGRSASLDHGFGRASDGTSARGGLAHARAVLLMFAVSTSPPPDVFRICVDNDHLDNWILLGKQHKEILVRTMPVLHILVRNAPFIIRHHVRRKLLPLVRLAMLRTWSAGLAALRFLPVVIPGISDATPPAAATALSGLGT